MISRVFMLFMASVFFLFFAEDGVAATGLSKTEQRARAGLKRELRSYSGKEELDSIFSDPRLVLDRSVIATGATGINYDYFDPKFGILSRESLDRGLGYWRKNEEYLNGASRAYGVPPSAILAILRVETNFGRFIGKRPVFNSLYSVYVLSARRRRWSLNELKSFLKVAKIIGGDIFSMKGSVAGAFGLPQFLPSSYLAFAVDGDGDGRIDLWNDADAISSIANYLKKTGWSDAYDGKRRAVLAYNHDTRYADAVFVYAGAIDALKPYADVAASLKNDDNPASK